MTASASQSQDRTACMLLVAEQADEQCLRMQVFELGLFKISNFEIHILSLIAESRGVENILTEVRETLLLVPEYFRL